MKYTHIISTYHLVGNNSHYSNNKIQSNYKEIKFEELMDELERYIKTKNFIILFHKTYQND